MERVWELVRDGVLVQSAIALSVTAAVIYMAIVGIPESEALLLVTGAAVQHFFSSVSERRAEQRVMRALQQ